MNRRSRMKEKAMAFSVSATGMLLVSVLVGCASSETKQERIPLKVRIEFPSTQAAIATESVRLYAFRGTVDCIGLGRGLGPPTTWNVSPAADLGVVNTCDIAKAEINLAFGDYTVLAVGSSQGKTLMLGCGTAKFDGKHVDPGISMLLSDPEREITNTDCTTLAERCGGKTCKPIP
jgi:hypothetical protein